MYLEEYKKGCPIAWRWPLNRVSGLLDNLGFRSRVWGSGLGFNGHRLAVVINKVGGPALRGWGLGFLGVLGFRLLGSPDGGH